MYHFFLPKFSDSWDSEVEHPGVPAALTSTWHNNGVNRGLSKLHTTGDTIMPCLVGTLRFPLVFSWKQLPL